MGRIQGVASDSHIFVPRVNIVSKIEISQNNGSLPANRAFEEFYTSYNLNNFTS